MSRRGQPTRGGPPAWGVCKELTSPQHKKQLVAKCQEGPHIWKDTLEQHRQQKINMRFGIWNVKRVPTEKVH
jgi:hypothetical protein